MTSLLIDFADKSDLRTLVVVLLNMVIRDILQVFVD